MSMDIAQVSMALAQNQLASDVGVAMLSKALDTSQALGQGMIEMLDSSAMEQSITPNLGANIDIRV